MSPRSLSIVLLAFAAAAPAQAQISRVFVSVTGNDANVCSNVATPCRTLVGGIAQVDANGEVIVTETGSYAGATITKSVKINVPAGLTAFSGLPVVSNPGAGNTVVIRGLTLKAATPGAGTGLTQLSGALIVENSVIDGWDTGIRVTATDPVSISGTTVRNNLATGIFVQANSTVTIQDSRLIGNGLGTPALGYAGLFAVAGRVSVDRSECFRSYACLWFRGDTSPVTGTVRRTFVSGSEFGIVSQIAGTDVT